MKELSYNTPDGERQFEVYTDVIAYDLAGQSLATAEQKFGTNAIHEGKPYMGDDYDLLCTKAMQNGGWHFGAATTEARSKFLQHKLPGGCTLAGTLCRESDNQLKIALPRLDVKVDPDLSVEQAVVALGRQGYTVLHHYAFSKNLFQVSIPPGKDVFACAQFCENDGLFEFAEPEFVELLEERDVIRDTFFGEQWHLDKIAVKAVWETGVLGQDTHIAMIDSGFDLTHPDLADAISPQTGFYDRQGKLEINHSFFPLQHQHHGTFCAGMACARVNDIAVVGVAPESTVTCLVPVLQNLGSQAILARAVSYAANPSRESGLPMQFGAEDGADIISCSLGPSQKSDWVMRSVLRDAIDDAWENGRGGRGIPVFWAVANADQRIRGILRGDQVIAHRNTIAVGSSSKADLVDLESAFGPELDFLAPGVDVVSASNRTPERAEVHSGASYAAPCAAATAALMLTVNPNLLVNEIRDIMRTQCDKIGPDEYQPVAAGSGRGETRNDRYGFGRINAARAVAEAKRRMAT